jgi:hypothetical protein
MPAIWRASVRAGRVPEDLYSRVSVPAGTSSTSIPSLMNACADFQPPHWLPLEHASRALYALTQAHGSDTTPLTFYGLENTRSVPWTSVISSLLSLYPSLHEAPAPEWIHYVRILQEGQEENKVDLIDNALLDYVEDFVCRQSLPRLATDNLQKISPEVARLISYDYSDAVVEKYIRYAMQS